MNIIYYCLYRIKCNREVCNPRRKLIPYLDKKPKSRRCMWTSVSTDTKIGRKIRASFILIDLLMNKEYHSSFQCVNDVKP